MKSKIKLNDSETFDAVVGLLNLLEDFKLPAAIELNCDAKSDWTCGDCEAHLDNCECENDEEYEGYDMYNDEAEYDET